MSEGHSRAPSRRAILRYVGIGTPVAMAASLLGPLARRATAAAPGVPTTASRPASAPTPEAGSPWVGGNGNPLWTPVDYPVPVPGDGGTALADPIRLANYAVRDDLVLPAGFRYDVVAQWGDQFGPANRPGSRVRFGFNADYTGLLPVRGGPPGEYWLIVNHEYISARPWLQGYPELYGRDLLGPFLAALGNPPTTGKGPATKPGEKPSERWLDVAIDFQDPEELARLDPKLVDAARAICQAAVADLGVSVLRVRRGPDGSFAVVADSPHHRRFSGNGAQNAGRGCPYGFTGPAAPLLGTPAGTMHNCSGATTPWGTFLTCEENYQESVIDPVTPEGEPLPTARLAFAGTLDAPGERHPTGLPFEFEGVGLGCEPPLDGRQYGWVCEVDPVAGTLRKHTALGRFRHENVALRCEPGRPLAAYMGDDRRSGHVWKFVSDGAVADAADPATGRLLESGTLYAARFNPDFTGRWVAVAPETPLAYPEPRHCADGFLVLPRRPAGGAVAVGRGPKAELPPYAWVRSIERYAGKPFARVTLGDLVRPGGSGSGADARGLLLLDAFVMASAAGATACSRPEDVEVHPGDGSVYVAFTDSTGSDDGSPDVRIFPDSRRANSRQYGAIYRLVEDADDPAARTFTWGKFVSSGEAADGGGGFACADNLAFDPAGNLWVVSDITTPAHNFPVDRGDPRAAAGTKNFPGVFGNNAMFVIPTAGPAAGVPHCFATAPMEAELTGPTFTPDGRSLLLSVQHPGEMHGTRGRAGVGQPAERRRTLTLAARDGRLFEQERTVPVGSNFPGGRRGTVPRPCVVCVRRASESA